jgi:hypothetical protein
MTIGVSATTAGNVGTRGRESLGAVAIGAGVEAASRVAHTPAAMLMNATTPTPRQSVPASIRRRCGPVPHHRHFPSRVG